MENDQKINKRPTSNKKGQHIDKSGEKKRAWTFIRQMRVPIFHADLSSRI